uniref:hypothetical protein n=1 Tax=uncultured Caulobacter sp. TaxID=158749 RepID=UPI0025E46134|nr:hypothetical protein [uncultured Caulobacter sp.]
MCSVFVVSNLMRLVGALDCRPGNLLDYDFDAADLAGADEEDWASLSACGRGWPAKRVG